MSEEYVLVQEAGYSYESAMNEITESYPCVGHWPWHKGQCGIISDTKKAEFIQVRFLLFVKKTIFNVSLSGAQFPGGIMNVSNIFQGRSYKTNEKARNWL